MTRHGGTRAGPYQPLVVYLARLDEDCVTLSLAEIEVILGFPMPPVSRTRAYWIAKVRTLNRAGWRYVAPPPARPRQTLPPLTSVTFVRLAAHRRAQDGSGR